MAAVLARVGDRAARDRGERDRGEKGERGGQRRMTRDRGA
jgi:hypothetical protein